MLYRGICSILSRPKKETFQTLTTDEEMYSPMSLLKFSHVHRVLHRVQFHNCHEKESAFVLPPHFLQPHTPNPFLSSNLSSYYSLSSYLLPHDRGSDLSAMNETLNQQLKWHILMNPYIALNASPTLLLSTWYVSYDKKYIKYIVFPIPALLLETLSNSVS